MWMVAARAGLAQVSAAVQARAASSGRRIGLVMGAPPVGIRLKWSHEGKHRRRRFIPAGAAYSNPNVMEVQELSPQASHSQ